MSMLNIMCVVLETPYGGTCYADLTGGVPLPKGYAMMSLGLNELFFFLTFYIFYFFHVLQGCFPQVITFIWV